MDGQFDKLKQIITSHESSPEPPYWFHNHEDEVPDNLPDEAESLCYKCIHKLLPIAKIGHHFGGGYCNPSDGCVHCVECGVLLQYELTDYGLENELSHWEDCPPDKNSNGDEYYHLARIAGGVHSDKRKSRLAKLCSPIEET